MPLYEYRCHKCGKTFEVLQKFSDKPLRKHPDCGGSVERLVSASSFQLKGGGWYAEGYSKEAPAKSASAEGSSSDGKSETKAESKTESKTESKSESKSESKTDSKPAKSESKPTKTKA